MDNGIKPKSEKLFLLDNTPLYKKDLLRALSWLDFVPDPVRTPEDMEALLNLVKVINIITRNG